MVIKLDPRTCATLPVFRAFTGCDTVSAFTARGKKTAWDTWTDLPDVTEAFEERAVHVTSGGFVVLMYIRTSNTMEVNEVTKLNSEVHGPGERPTHAGCSEATHQACQHLERGVSSWPWAPKPLWLGLGWPSLRTTLPEASQSCYELIHCGCKKVCKKGCTGQSGSPQGPMLLFRRLLQDLYREQTWQNMDNTWPIIMKLQHYYPHHCYISTRKHFVSGHWSHLKCWYTSGFLHIKCNM